jgi:uncharacterized membrane protein YtjA (UPF0391 family)
MRWVVLACVLVGVSGCSVRNDARTKELSPLVELRPRTEVMLHRRASLGDNPVTLLKWALICLLISIVAALLGFTGIAAGAAEIAKILFYIFLVIFIVILLLAVITDRLVF